MSILSPWLLEPEVSSRYRYLIRTGDADGRGVSGQSYPNTGYFAAALWGQESDALPVIHYNYLDKTPSKEGDGAGIFGFLDGKLGGKYFSSDCTLGKSFQLFVVDVFEIEEGYVFYEHRAPRGWIKCNGSYEDVCQALCAENTAYSREVIYNMEKSLFILRCLEDQFLGGLDYNMSYINTDWTPRPPPWMLASTPSHNLSRVYYDQLDGKS